MTITLPTHVEKAIIQLNNNGYDAYVVGGCVRDSLLGRQPNDWDITTSAHPQQIIDVFSNCRIIPTGIQHGTVTVLIDNIPLEITTYRIDGEYSDNRHPNDVSFTDNLREDLARRDFTINALAYHPSKGLVDCFSGLADLDNRQLVCVGDPDRRFTEDALRILRALRFSAQFGFAIESVTARAIHRLCPLLRRIANERIQEELSKLLCGEFVKPILLAYADVLGVILPELIPMIGLEQQNPYHFLNVYEHTVETVTAIQPDRILRLAMLFHDTGKPACYTRDEYGIDHFSGHAPISAAIAEQALTRLRYDRQTIDTVKTLVIHHDDDLFLTDYALKSLLHRLGVNGALALIEIQKADVIGQHPDRLDRLQTLDMMKDRLHTLIANGACFSLQSLAIDGNDLKTIGYQGKAIGDMLNSALDEVMAGHLPNERATLLQYAQKRK